ncbi:hypothetical protein J2T07_001836 [Luteibacter jiangsuensis]|uniref:Uncharacterized protein n=1 Tax=Luteibacter jiangsuensis TaxID=637577 RepID=A0ABT9SXC4_9GAMM|nr:hypothetical protein [Luteibacter jiangsuensis]MDQ0009659.1 hypothetical protein [Luteibacter jiangsuensis]
MRNRTSIALLAALTVPGAATAQTVIEPFNHLPAQTIESGRPLVLEHFDIDILGSAAAAIKPATHDDDIASGMTLGIPEGHSLATMFFYFKQPWHRVDFTLVVPPSHPLIQSVAMLYGNAEHPYAMTIWHSAAGHRVRLSLSQPDGTPFTSMLLHLQRGAYIDNVELR